MRLASPPHLPIAPPLHLPITPPPHLPIAPPPPHLPVRFASPPHLPVVPRRAARLPAARTLPTARTPPHDVPSNPLTIPTASPPNRAASPHQIAHLPTKSAVQPSRMAVAAQVEPSMWIENLVCAEREKDWEEQWWILKRWHASVPAVESFPHAAGTASREDNTMAGFGSSKKSKIVIDLNDDLSGDVANDDGPGFCTDKNKGVLLHPYRSMLGGQRCKKRKSPCSNIVMFRSPLSRMMLSPRPRISSLPSPRATHEEQSKKRVNQQRQSPVLSPDVNAVLSSIRDDMHLWCMAGARGISHLLALVPSQEQLGSLV